MTTFRRQTSGALLLLGVALACGGRNTSSKPGAAAAGGQAISGSTAGGAGATSLGGSNNEAGVPNTGGSLGDSAGEPAAAGAAGASEPSCDAACLDSVANQPSDFGIPWKSSWFIEGCHNQQDSDCVNVDACPNQNAAKFEDKGARTLETFPIGGNPGQHYKVTFTFNAISGAKEYRNGTRDQGESAPPEDSRAVYDSFYRDGEAVPSNYDVWKLSVLDEAGAELRHYFMNAFPHDSSPQQPFERRHTYSLGYTKSIVVVGGGKVTYLVQDSNCHAMDNCALDPNGVGCDPDRIMTLPNEPGTLLPPMYQDPVDGVVKPTEQLNELATGLMQPWHAQAGHFTITNVEVTDDPVTHDYL